MKFKRLLAALLATLLLCTLCPFALAQSATEISTPEALSAIRNDLDGNFVLTADIVIPDEAYAQGGIFEGGFLPIGLALTTAGDDVTLIYQATSFSGTLDGNGHTISNLKINVNTADPVPFAYIGLIAQNSGTVKNLVLKNPNYTANYSAADRTTALNIGGLVAKNIGNVKNCAVVDATISSTAYNETTTYVGGIAGNNDYSYADDQDGTIQNCYFSGAITADNATGKTIYAGGLVGMHVIGTLQTSFAAGRVNASTTASDKSAIYCGDVAGYVSMGALTHVYSLKNNQAVVGNSVPGGNICAALTTDQALQTASYSTFDFADTWLIESTHAVLRIAHQHSLIWDMTATHHRQICRSVQCGYEVVGSYGPHTFDSASDSCLTCGYTPSNIPAPTITTQPTNATVANGDTSTFTVSAQGENLSYQWYRTVNGQSTPLTNDDRTQGANTATLTLLPYPAMCQNDGISYYCVISNEGGNVQSTAVVHHINHKDTDNKYASDKTHHFHECACGSQFNKAAHTYDNNWVTIIDPDYFKEGLREQYCSICNSNRITETIAPLTGADVAKVFTDIKITDWFYTNNSVYYAYNAGLFNGTSKTTFEPNASMTRAMFVTVLGRLHGAVVDHSAPSAKFKDVKAGEWYTGYVKWASDNGIVNGTSNTAFSPNDNVTREQICAMMVRYCDHAKITLGDVNTPITFKDAGKISDYAKVAVATCQKAGLVNGKGNNQFDPTGKATRAEVATILMNFVKNYK